MWLNLNFKIEFCYWWKITWFKKNISNLATFKNNRFHCYKLCETNYFYPKSLLRFIRLILAELSDFIFIFKFSPYTFNISPTYNSLFFVFFLILLFLFIFKLNFIFFSSHFLLSFKLFNYFILLTFILFTILISLFIISFSFLSLFHISLLHLPTLFLTYILVNLPTFLFHKFFLSHFHFSNFNLMICQYTFLFSPSLWLPYVFTIISQLALFLLY